MKSIILSITFVAACGSTPATAPAPRAAAPAAPAAPAYTAYVHGALAQRDLAQARTYHDGLVAASGDAARAAGDRGHHVMLGTGEPAAEVDEFLALDEWQSLDGPRAVYGDPKFQAAFGGLFASPTVPELYRRRPDWHTWGDLNGPRDGGPYWVMIVKGHLAKATDDENRRAHDAVAGGFEAAAKAAGDIAHVPHVAVDDPRVFLNVDVSTNHDGMLAVVRDPQFQHAFGALFDAPPDVRIYRATDWTQWGKEQP